MKAAWRIPLGGKRLWWHFAALASSRQRKPWQKVWAAVLSLQKQQKLQSAIRQRMSGCGAGLSSSASSLQWVAQYPTLPDSCITVDQRYNPNEIRQRLDLGLMRQAKSCMNFWAELTCLACRLSGPLGPILDSKQLVVLKLDMLSTALKQDQALAFMALASEVKAAGFDFAILHELVCHIYIIFLCDMTVAESRVAAFHILYSLKNGDHRQRSLH